jgi:hypothetical protein
MRKANVRRPRLVSTLASLSRAIAGFGQHDHLRKRKGEEVWAARFDTEILKQRMTMSLPLTGGCLCGALRFALGTSPPLAMYNCHCRGCQKASGAACLPLLLVSTAEFSLSGTPASFEHANPQDQHAPRYHCAQCGNSIFSSCAERPEIVLVNAMTLDDVTMFTPVADIWTAYAQPWVHWDRHIPKVYRAPPLLEPQVMQMRGED